MEWDVIKGGLTNLLALLGWIGAVSAMAYVTFKLEAIFLLTGAKRTLWEWCLLSLAAGGAGAGGFFLSGKFAWTEDRNKKFRDRYLGSLFVFCALCIGAIGLIRESVHVKLSVLDAKAVHQLADQPCNPTVRPNLAAPTWISAEKNR